MIWKTCIKEKDRKSRVNIVESEKKLPFLKNKNVGKKEKKNYMII